MKKTVNEGQNIFDVTLQYLGDIEATVSFLETNNFDFNTRLSGGLEVTINDEDIINKIIVNEFQRAGVGTGNELVQDIVVENWLFDETANEYVVTDDNTQILID